MSKRTQTNWRYLLSCCLFFIACFLPVQTAKAASENDKDRHRELVVGARVMPPFVLRDTDGSWRGIGVELWQEIANELGWSYRLEEVDLDEMLQRLQAGSMDVGIGAITVTSEREQVIDFSHPFYTAGLGISLRSEQSMTWIDIFRSVINRPFLYLVSALILVFFIMGVIIWLLERKHNPDQFGGHPVRGIGAGFWWSVVTMTTVGYGDKTPVTFGGRLLALLWMLISVIIVAGITATIASSLTINRLTSLVNGPGDLYKVRVGTIQNSTSEVYLRTQRINYQNFSNLEQALQATVDDEIDAVVYDAPMLQYVIQHKYHRHLRVLPGRFYRQDYAFALPIHSPLREPINRVLPDKVREGIEN